MRVILIVLDSVGIGALPDAAEYGDTGANTLMHIQEAVPSMHLPNLKSLGLYNIDGLRRGEQCLPARGAYGRLVEASKGKDTTTGHWEIAGLRLSTPFPTFPNGFPADFIQAFEQAIGRKTIGNIPASGTAILDELGEEHMRTGAVIVYTSADSVFQIAAHEAVVPLEELYSICETARAMLVNELACGRVIARPFEGEEGAFRRTANRHDYSIAPLLPTMLDMICAAGQAVAAVGKIKDIFAGQGVTKSVHTTNNMEGVDTTLAMMSEVLSGLIMTNLVDFDMQFGHRRDPAGYAEALMAFDARLPEIMGAMRADDVLILTADHGCDPTRAGTDHTREYIPFLAYGEGIRPNTNIGTRETFADIAATVLDVLKVEGETAGVSFLEMIYANQSK